jgi:hypothetical protein
MGVGMLCQYSRQRPVSREKHAAAAEAGMEEEGWLMSGVIVTVVAGGYRPLLASFTAIIRRANAAHVVRSRTPAR